MKRTGTKTIKTERLVLRKILPSDYFSTVKWYTNPKFAEFALSKRAPTKLEIVKLTFGSLIKYFDKNYYNWAIIYNGRMHGFVELQPLLNNENAFSFRYKLDMSINGKGIMTEYGSPGTDAPIKYDDGTVGKALKYKIRFQAIKTNPIMILMSEHLNIKKRGIYYEIRN